MRLRHAREPVHHVEDRKRGMLRESVFGIEDGLVSTLGVITGVASGSGLRTLVILTGLVVIVVEAISMAAGSYLSSKSEAQLSQKILDEELHEIRTDPEKERRELQEFYTVRGFTPTERDILIERVMSDENLLLEEMAHKELGIFPGAREDPLRNAAVMWIAYMVGGVVPVLPYILGLDMGVALPASVAATAVALFVAGALKGRLVGVHPGKSGIEMAFVGMAAAAIGYIVGRVAGHLLGTPVL